MNDKLSRVDCHCPDLDCDMTSNLRKKISGSLHLPDKSFDNDELGKVASKENSGDRRRGASVYIGNESSSDSDIHTDNGTSSPPPSNDINPIINNHPTTSLSNNQLPNNKVGDKHSNTKQHVQTTDTNNTIGTTKTITKSENDPVPQAPSLLLTPTPPYPVLTKGAAIVSSVSPTSTTSTTSPRHPPHRHNDSNKLLTTYYILRIVVFSITICLSLIAMLYAVANLITLEAVNLFCKDLTPSEVYQHSFEYSLNEGAVNNSCWYIHREVLDRDTIEKLDLDIYEPSFNDIYFGDVIACLFFMTLAIILLITGSYWGYYLFLEFYYILCLRDLTKLKNKRFIRTNKAQRAKNKRHGKQNSQQNMKQQQQHMHGKNNSGNHMHGKHLSVNNIGGNNSGHSSHSSQQSNLSGIFSPSLQIRYKYKDNICLCCCCTVIDCIYRAYYECIRCEHGYYLKYIAPYYYNDSKIKVISLFGFECIEIFVQFYGLLLYGGWDLFEADNKNILAQETYVIKSFAMIIGLNCLLTGWLWILYIVWHDIIYGSLFVSLLFSIDALFEMLYTLFPLIYLTSGNGIFDTKSLGLLKQQNFYIVVQSGWSMCLLARKCWKLLRDLDPIHLELQHLRHQIKQYKRYNTRRNLQQKAHNNINNTSTGSRPTTPSQASQARSGGINTSIFDREPWIHTKNWKCMDVLFVVFCFLFFVFCFQHTP